MVIISYYIYQSTNVGKLRFQGIVWRGVQWDKFLFLNRIYLMEIAVVSEHN